MVCGSPLDVLPRAIKLGSQNENDRENIGQLPIFKEEDIEVFGSFTASAVSWPEEQEPTGINDEPPSSLTSGFGGRESSLPGCIHRP